MKDITTVEGLKRLNVFDIENFCKYYKFVYVPTLTLISTIDVDNYVIAEYNISNYVLNISWNMWKNIFKVSILQNDELLRLIEVAVVNDMVFAYYPHFDGSFFKLIFVFDFKHEKRPLYIYKTYDVMEGY